MTKTDNQPQANASEDCSHRTKRGAILGWCARHPKITILFTLLVLLCALTGVLHVAAENRLENQIVAIRAKGEPTTVDDLNRLRALIPDEENMALGLLEHSRAARAVEIPDDKRGDLPYVGQASIKQLSGERLTAGQLKAVRWYLGETAEALAGIHQSLRLERGSPEAVLTRSAVSTLLNWGSEYRHAVNMLALECEVAAHDGDSKRATELVAEMIHIDAAVRDENSLIAVLTRIASQAWTLGRIARMASLCSLSEAELRDTQLRVAQIEYGIDFHRCMLAERVMFLDAMLSARSSAAPAGGQTGPGVGTGSAWSYIPIVPAADTSSGLRVFSEMIEAVQAPSIASIRRFQGAQASVGSPGGYCVLSKIALAAYPRSVVLWVRFVAENRAMQATLACERYRLANGRWPESLDVLVPKYLTGVPMDPFDGEPIRYAQTDEGIKTWSIGEDETDDGGDVRGLRRENKPRPTDFGFVLVNPDLRGRSYAGPVDDD